MRPNLKILIVDDSKVARAYLKSQLSGADRKVTTAANGVDALAVLENMNYDLILLDLNLPDITGLEILRTLRRTDQETCVVIVTGQSGVQSAIEAGQQGADGYIEKDEVMGPHALPDELFHHIEQSMKIREGRRAAAELERIRAELYAMVSHDLRNPINIIQLAITLLRDKVDSDDQETNNLVSMIENNTDNLLRQLDDFLEVARMESGAVTLDLTTANLTELATKMAEELQMLAENQGHQLILKTNSSNYTAQFDPHRVRQIIFNLVENAIKYTPDPGDITLGLMTQPRYYTIMVSDTGIGVPSDQRDRLFTRYWRARNAEHSKIKGTGLGLLIVRQIAESHGGRAWYRAREGGGSIFGVTLPRDIESG